MSKNNPETFGDLSLEELRKTAVEDFAVDIKSNDNKTIVLAALAEAGVEWSTYAELKGLTKEEPVVIENTEAITTQEVKEEPVTIITQEPIKAGPQKYLVKMERLNQRFDIRGYSFTSAHPYALVSSADVEHILTKEKGFRMAYPSEVEEFYS